MLRAIERASEWAGVLGACLLVPLVLATCYEVFARYLFGAPTIWAYEVGYTLTGAHFLLGMAFTLKYGEHIRIDVFSGKFSPRTRAVIDLLGYAIVLPLTAWLTLYLFFYLRTGYITNEKSGQSALNLPVWPLRVIFCLAFLLLALQVIAEVAKLLRALRKEA
ncbi:MAG TPA: TRAP transporter small permease subunit [Burkholderiales bacterium]|nr:TRAP transporter small permease subunit [Burkholderiales bacterium]